MRYLIFLLLFSIKFSGYSQISASNATAAAQLIAGEGVTISNAQFTGNAEQLSTFFVGGTDASQLGMGTGVVITTNKRGHLQSGVSSELGTDFKIPAQSFDADLNEIATSNNMYSTAFLEFDFRPKGSTISFSYVFSSNEYYSYTCCSYNDAFGIFLSGSTIIGKENVAILPGTLNPVSVNSVNSGIPGASCPNAICPPDVNTSLYNANAYFYEGSTKLLTATYNVQCNQTYRLKIAICNIQDENLNSAVFIKGGSLVSNFYLNDLTIEPSPACEGSPLTLKAEGSLGYIYSWKAANEPVFASGLDLQEVTIPATISTTYSVSIAHPDGCSLQLALPVTVHSQNNDPPTLQGINATEKYTAYVQAGQELCFDIPSFDAANEEVTLVWDVGIPSGSFIKFGWPKETGTFCWTPTQEDIGWHSFQVLVKDNNACDSKEETYTFRIKVSCSWHELCVSYENRIPGINPLPAYTSAAQCINAGITEPVVVGTDNVVFEAPEINLGDFFDSPNSPYFDAIYNDFTSINDCESCCDNFTDFTIDLPLPNIITPNGDGINDVWFAKDNDNPLCAFNAVGFEFWIINRWGSLMYYQSKNANLAETSCCPFQSTPVYEPGKTNIFWNGYTNQEVSSENENLSIGQIVPAGTYFYVLKLYGCNQNKIYQDFIQVITGSNLPPITESFILPNGNKSQLSRDSIGKISVIAEILPEQEWKIELYPNPAKDKVSINSTIKDYELNVFDAKGNILISKKINSTTEDINVSNLSNGTYRFVLKTANGEIKETSLLKQ
jgi:hypothetical protein